MLEGRRRAAHDRKPNRAARPYRALGDAPPLGLDAAPSRSIAARAADCGHGDGDGLAMAIADDHPSASRRGEAMESKAALGEAYDGSAQSYDQTAGAIYLRALRGLLPFASVAPRPAILDVGCGTGINLLELAHTMGPCSKLVGVDLSSGMLEVARRKAAAAGVAATFQVGDAEALELPDGTFDLVVCNSVYHWFPDRSRAIGEMARVLRPGGQLLLGTIASPGYEEWMGVVNTVWTRLFGSACTALPAMPTPGELSGQLRAAGMGIEIFRYQITPFLVTEPRTFLSMMAVVAPVWLPESPDGDAQRVLEETLGALQSPSGFLCTQAGIEAIARKGAPLPPQQRRAAPPATLPWRPGNWMT
jgi:ubiquinone/menaquinone biosynthesis C-methylase UbiE